MPLIVSVGLLRSGSLLVRMAGCAKLNEVDYSLYRYVKEKESRFFLTQQEMLNISTNVVSIKYNYGKSFTIDEAPGAQTKIALRRLER